MYNRPKLISNRFRKIDDSDRVVFTKPLPEDEIKEVVRCCGNEKALGPNEFTFKILKFYWGLIKDYVILFVRDFGDSGILVRGCNSSFISLIPKSKDPLYLKDYRPENLVGCLYKVLYKVLANRPKRVITKTISPEQSTYVRGRSILDGPYCLMRFVLGLKR